MRSAAMTALMWVGAALTFVSAIALGRGLGDFILQCLARLGPDRGLEKEKDKFGAVVKFAGFDETRYLRGQHRALDRKRQALMLRRLHIGVQLRRRALARRTS